MAKCDTCVFKTMRNGACPIFNADMTGKDGCPYHSTDLHICGVCGNPIIEKSIIEMDENGVWHEMCWQCANAPRCSTCIHSYCAFQQDTHCPEPPMVMRQTRQGNMIVQQQVMNPKRVEATCRQGCLCFNEDGLDDGSFCCRQNECGCNKYHTIWRS
jgi:hypothetical protein